MQIAYCKISLFGVLVYDSSNRLRKICADDLNA
jgi:hypothetical protein